MATGCSNAARRERQTVPHGQHLERMTRGADFLKIKPPFIPRNWRNSPGSSRANQMPTDSARDVDRGPGARG